MIKMMACCFDSTKRINLNRLIMRAMVCNTVFDKLTDIAPLGIYVRGQSVVELRRQTHDLLKTVTKIDNALQIIIITFLLLFKNKSV